MTESIDHGYNIGALSKTLLLLLGNKRPELVDVDDRLPVDVAGQVVVAHTNLTEVTRVVLIEVDSMVVLTTSITTTSGMLTMLSDTTVTMAHVSSEFSCLTKSGWLRSFENK